jgi:serine/threonine-protein kinase HipA
MREDGQVDFAYAQGWLERVDARPISVALPLPAPGANGRVGQRAALAFFDGLLPEEAQRGGAARALGIALQNSFALLAALGGDVAGALSLVPQSEVGAHLGARELSPRLSEGAALSAADLAALVVDLPQRPMLAGVEGRPRLSLAGAQPKLPLVRLASGGLRVPLSLDGGTEPSTHILKPEPDALPGLVANEALIMRLASDIGLSVADVDVVQAGERPCLLVTRYDRTAAGVRLHQEDFAQGLGIMSVDKYDPGLRDIFGLVRAHSRQVARDVLALLDVTVFNVAVGNCDAHAKNFSLLHDGPQPRLAPFYDLLSTAPYDNVSNVFAMRINGRRTFDELQSGDWAALAEATGLSGSAIPRRVTQVLRRIVNAVNARIAAGDDTALIALVRARTQHLLSMLGKG